MNGDLMFNPYTLRRAGIALGACLMMLGGCHKAPPTDVAAQPAAGGASVAAAGDEGGAADGVTLSAAQVAKLGIETRAAEAASAAPEAAGYAVVIAHDAIAQAAAELVSAQAVARQSQAALARVERLAGGAGAMPADVQEAAARQAEVDAAALALARRRLSAAYGPNPPWRDGDASLLAALADGSVKLVRVTFPLGQLGRGSPPRIDLAHIDAARADQRWTASLLWDAPADADVPGRSYFAVLKGSDAGEGERLVAWAPVGAAVAGVVVPESAAVISDGRYWCYVERGPGTFVRVAIDTRQPVAGGYFVAAGVGAGERIVIAAAGQLLARELNAGAAAD